MDVQQRAYSQAAATARDSSRCLAVALDEIGVPKTLLDVGCGDGHLVRQAVDIGVEAAGVDLNLPEIRTLLSETRKRCILARADLRFPLHWTPAEVVLCWEVAEHLPPESADVLCASLWRVTAKGGRLLFSAATPGQGGSGHVNEQPHGYWLEKLIGLGFEYEATLTTRMRDLFTEVAPAAWWYGKNLLIFRGPR